MDVLIVIDMQNDFITGSLGSAQAQQIVPKVRERIESFQGAVFFTLDTHGEDYLRTQEGRLLPVPHCIKGSEGWKLHPSLSSFAVSENCLEKESFGSFALPERLKPLSPETITCVGLCTDICVIVLCAILKTAFPESRLVVDASCCAGVSPESHGRALRAMEAFQVQVINA